MNISKQLASVIRATVKSIKLQWREYKGQRTELELARITQFLHNNKKAAYDIGRANVLYSEALKRKEAADALLAKYGLGSAGAGTAEWIQNETKFAEISGTTRPLSPRQLRYMHAEYYIARIARAKDRKEVAEVLAELGINWDLKKE